MIPLIGSYVQAPAAAAECICHEKQYTRIIIKIKIIIIINGFV